MMGLIHLLQMKKQANDQVHKDKENIIEQEDVEENFECCDDPDSDIESIVNTDELNHQSKIPTELMQNEHNKTPFDFPSSEYYEFITNNEEAASTDQEEAELWKDETCLNNENDERQMAEEDLDEYEFEVQNEFLKHEQSKANVDFLCR